jgi:glycosyltransferase involved in cell wall biosynthesis
VLEAFAYGKPVIASRLGGIRELVGDDERGILVPPANPGLLAAAMEQAVQNPDGLIEKGHKARKYVIANHPPETHYAHLFDIYQKVTLERSV